MDKVKIKKADDSEVSMLEIASRLDRMKNEISLFSNTISNEYKKYRNEDAYSFELNEVMDILGEVVKRLQYENEISEEGV